MVRLKKKRFVILDYSIVPNDADMQVANTNPHISIPAGAGKTSCSNADCNKVGVPVLLYDSEPNEPTSLYIRSGLCFTCQRNLNEKRRTQRKRPSDAGVVSRDSAVFGSHVSSKKHKGTSEAIVLHPMPGVKRHADGYSFSEIGIDLHTAANEVAMNTNRLVNAVSSSTETTSSADLAATAAAVAASVSANLAPDDAATNAAVNSASGLLPETSGTSGNTNGQGEDEGESSTNAVDINALYDKAYTSMNKAILLLTQWKASWDAAIAAAVAQESVDDHGLAEAVASAAAVAAAAAGSLQGIKKENGDIERNDEAYKDVEAHEV